MNTKTFEQYVEQGEEFIEHHGIGGMSWYKHRFGRYYDHAKYARGGARHISKGKYSEISPKNQETKHTKETKTTSDSSAGKRTGLTDKQKTILKSAAIVGGTIATGYATYKVSKLVSETSTIQPPPIPITSKSGETVYFKPDKAYYDKHFNTKTGSTLMNMSNRAMRRRSQRYNKMTEKGIRDYKRLHPNTKFNDADIYEKYREELNHRESNFSHRKVNRKIRKNKVDWGDKSDELRTNYLKEQKNKYTQYLKEQKDKYTNYLKEQENVRNEMQKEIERDKKLHRQL